MLNMPEFPLYQLSCVLFFLVPMVFIVVLYVRIGLRIQSDTLAQNVEGYVHGETKQAQSRKTITRMLSKCSILNKPPVPFVPAKFQYARCTYVNRYRVSVPTGVNVEYQPIYPRRQALFRVDGTLSRSVIRN